jgi:hypothetical protein
MLTVTCVSKFPSQSLQASFFSFRFVLFFLSNVPGSLNRLLDGTCNYTHSLVYTTSHPEAIRVSFGHVVPQITNPPKLKPTGIPRGPRIVLSFHHQLPVVAAVDHAPALALRLFPGQPRRSYYVTRFRLLFLLVLLRVVALSSFDPHLNFNFNVRLIYNRVTSTRGERTGIVADQDESWSGPTWDSTCNTQDSR